MSGTKADAKCPLRCFPGRPLPGEPGCHMGSTELGAVSLWRTGGLVSHWSLHEPSDNRAPAAVLSSHSKHTRSTSSKSSVRDSRGPWPGQGAQSRLGTRGDGHRPRSWPNKAAGSTELSTDTQTAARGGSPRMCRPGQGEEAPGAPQRDSVLGRGLGDPDSMVPKASQGAHAHTRPDAGHRVHCLSQRPGRPSRRGGTLCPWPGPRAHSSQCWAR